MRRVSQSSPLAPAPVVFRNHQPIAENELASVVAAAIVDISSPGDPTVKRSRYGKFKRKVKDKLSKLLK
jgi:hypothetical protein